MGNQMTKALGLGSILMLVAVVRLTMPEQLNGHGQAAMALGFVLTVSFILGKAVNGLGLPSISGYILVGMFFGPHLLRWAHPVFAVLGKEEISALQLLDAVALGLIALSAGGELKLAAMREHALRIIGVVTGQMVLVMVGLTVLVIIFRGWFPLLSGLDENPALAAALLFGVTALANSPATALAIIQEYRSEGPVTEVVLAVTVVKDVLVISLFTVVLSITVLLLRPDVGLGGEFLGNLFWELTGSIVMGLLLGWLVSRYMKWLGHEVPLLVLGVAFAAVTLLPALHLSGLLALMVAGFYIENFSDHGDELIKAIEHHALPVYVVFFTIAGAGLDLSALEATWPLALFLVACRLGLTIMGTSLGAFLTGAPAVLVRYGWSGFVAQAGVTLGFAILIEQRFPELGGTVKTVILAIIAVNQIVGPILFRLGLYLAREIPSD